MLPDIEGDPFRQWRQADAPENPAPKLPLVPAERRPGPNNERLRLDHLVVVADQHFLGRRRTTELTGF
jgi:hypothetical protein